MEMKARKKSHEPVLQIRCKSVDTKIAFKGLAVRLDENYEETLKRLLELEKEHPLHKKEKGLTIRF